VQAILQAALCGGLGTGDGPGDMDALKRRVSILSTKYVKERRQCMSLTAQVDSLTATNDRLQQELDAKAKTMAVVSKHVKQLEIAKVSVPASPRGGCVCVCGGGGAVGGFGGRWQAIHVDRQCCDCASMCASPGYDSYARARHL
jgi:hypothetical protein